MQARVTRISASVGVLISASGTFSIVTSCALCMTVARIVLTFLTCLHHRSQRYRSRHHRRRQERSCVLLCRGLATDHCHLCRRVTLSGRLDVRGGFIDLGEVTPTELQVGGPEVFFETME